VRVLFLTWEFPPLIAGGLGTACFGMVRALLELGIEVELVLPAVEQVYFPLRRPEDVLDLPIKLVRPNPEVSRRLEAAATIEERLELIGISSVPESYLTPGLSGRELWTSLIRHQTPSRDGLISLVRENLEGDEPLIHKVQELAARAASLANELQFDIIHAHDWLTFPAGVAVQEITGKPLVAHIHATEFDRCGGPGDERIHQIEYAGLNAADLVIAVSRFTAEMVINRYRIEPKRIRVVHNAHSMPPTRVEDKRRLFKSPLILFLGRITVQKGPDYFLELARKVLKRHPETRFVMAGAGDMMRKMIHRSASYRLKQRFLFTDFLNRRQVEEILKAADIFIMPSISEPFGIAPLEAMAYGVVAIISKQSGVAEVVRNAYQVDFWDTEKMADIVCYLLEHPEEREKTARAGQDEVFRIQWSESGQAIADIYRELAGA